MSARGRHGARRLLVQALYQNQVGGHATDELVSQFSGSTDFAAIDSEYLLALLNEILDNKADLESHIASAADRPVEQLDPVERAVLRLATYELLYRLDIPYKVSINEAVQLTKKFGAEQGHAFVNGVLDKLAHKLRAVECKKAGKQAAGR